jgi:hypothetical protein
LQEFASSHLRTKAAHAPRNDGDCLRSQTLPTIK